MVRVLGVLLILITLALGGYAVAHGVHGVHGALLFASCCVWSFMGGLLVGADD